jgi:hypothetical protein
MIFSCSALARLANHARSLSLVVTSGKATANYVVGSSVYFSLCDNLSALRAPRHKDEHGGAAHFSLCAKIRTAG